MAQQLTIKLSKEELIKIIKSYLVQEDNTQDHVNYDIEWRFNDDDYYYSKITFTIVKKTSIGEYPGELREVLSKDTIYAMLEKTFELGEYEIDNWEYIVEEENEEEENEENENKSFDGVEILLMPIESERTFVMDLSQE